MEKKRFDIGNMVQLGWILIHAAYIVIIIDETFEGKALERLDHLSQILMLLAIFYAGHYAKKTYDTAQEELKHAEESSEKSLKIAKDELELAKKAAKFERDLKLYEIFEARFDKLHATLKSRGRNGELSLLWNYNKQEPVYELIGEWDNEVRYKEISSIIEVMLMMHIICYKDDWIEDYAFKGLIASKVLTDNDIGFNAIIKAMKWLDKSEGFRQYVLDKPKLKDFFHVYLLYDFTKHN